MLTLAYVAAWVAGYIVVGAVVTTLVWCVGAYFEDGAAHTVDNEELGFAVSVIVAWPLALIVLVGVGVFFAFSRLARQSIRYGCLLADHLRGGVARSGQRP